MRVELQTVTLERKSRVILAGVDLELPAGQVTAVLGRSGSGLSSLLKVAAGLMTPARGRVLQDGVDLATLAGEELRRHQCRSGFVFQDAALWANTNLLGNLDLPLQAKLPQLSAGQRHERIHTLLNSLGFRADLSQRPAMLSLGQQKLVGYLRAVIPGPELLFLDEALGSLDRRWRRVLLSHLETLRQDGVTIVSASHDVELARTLADHVVVLEDGRVLAAGTVGEVAGSSDPKVREIVHGRSTGD